MRYILGILIGLGLLILVIVLLVKSLSGGSVENVIKPIDLPSYAATDSTAQLYIDGPTNGDTEHRAVRISVSNQDIKVDVIQGYQRNVIDNKSYVNNQAAYAVFLHALQNYDFGKGNTSKDLADERGFCALGNRYIYELKSGDSDVMRFWSTSCGGQGTFKGDGPTIRQLFINQVPRDTFRQMVSGIPIGS
ncbi:MAG: hypothetical protein ABI220_01055 [Candidatus Saccharimonadales bacterium]